MSVDAAMKGGNFVRLMLQGRMSSPAFVGKPRWKAESFAVVAKPFRVGDERCQELAAAKRTLMRGG